MARKRKSSRVRKQVEAFTHSDESRRNIPTAELQSVLQRNEEKSVRLAYERRNRDLDPQLVWRGKDAQDNTDLEVSAPVLYIQEKVHPKALIDDLERQSRQRTEKEESDAVDLFADFNGLPSLEAKTEFYQHDQNWSNRMILGDSLQVMASLAEREQLRGKVQCIYMDPPFGIKFNSNFQWSTTSREVKDGNKKHITREPEQVKAFRDTWRYGIHSYLSYLRDRLVVTKDLLAPSGSIFVQIGEANVHRVRVLLDEIFGEENFKNLVTCRVSSGTTREHSLKSVSDYLLWYGKDSSQTKFRRLLKEREIETKSYGQVQEPSGRRRPMSQAEKKDPSSLCEGSRVFRKLPLHSMNAGDNEPRSFIGTSWNIPSTGHWRYTSDGFRRLVQANRISADDQSLSSVYYHDDFPASELDNTWTDTGPEIVKSYVVQTSTKIIQRCILMTTDPGDIVLDPTCGSGTTAYVAEEWGRRWITIDTSRVALALARARIMGARYPYYLLADSQDGQFKEAELSGRTRTKNPTHGSISQGFVYRRVPHITLRSIANNTEIDTIIENLQPAVDAALQELNESLRGHKVPFNPTKGGRLGSTVRFDAPEDSSTQLPNGESVADFALLEWEVPIKAPKDWPDSVSTPLTRFWSSYSARQSNIDACIATNTEFENLYDQPYEDKGRVRVSGPFTVESLTPHRFAEIKPTLGDATSKDTNKCDEMELEHELSGSSYQFAAIILEQLRIAGIQQADKRHKIDFMALTGWPGQHLCAEGAYMEGATTRKAGIMIGPEHGTVSRINLVGAAREAAEANFDVLIACAFNFDAQSTDTNRLGRLPILKARMNADLQMSTDLKRTKGGNLFVIFGEPDIEVIELSDDSFQVRVNGVDLFDPRTGEVRSSETRDLACWFIDTNYDLESFFVRHAYFLGTNDPYQRLKSTLKTEIDAEAWRSLHSDTSRPFKKPDTGRVAVKAINHLGDEVMKVITIS